MKTLYQFLCFIFILGLASCLKDENVENQKYGLINLNQGKIIEIPRKSAEPRGVSLESKNELLNLDFLKVHLSAEHPASEDIKVTVNLDQSQTVIDDYNAEHGTTLELLTPDLYQLPNALEITIPKGSKDAYLKLNINPSTLDPVKTYAIFFKITDVDKEQYVISGNYNQELITISVKNEWHATYKVTGFCFHPTAPRPIDETKDLTTLGPVTMYAPLGDLYAAGYYFKFDVSAQNSLINGVNLGSTPGTFALLSSDNPSGTNQLLAEVNYGAKIGEGEWVSSKYNNTYDPATKTFWLHYAYGNPGAAREFYEKWERIE